MMRPSLYTLRADCNVKLRRLQIYYYAISHAINADKKRKLKLKIRNA